MQSAGTLSIELKSSLLGQGLVTVLAGLAIVALFYLQINFWLFVGIMLAIGVVWAWEIHRMNRRRWKRLLVSSGGQVVLVDRKNHRHPGKISARPFVSPALTCLLIRFNTGRRTSLCLFADSAETDDLRRLAAALRHGN